MTPEEEYHWLALEDINRRFWENFWAAVKAEFEAWKAKQPTVRE